MLFMAASYNVNILRSRCCPGLSDTRRDPPAGFINADNLSVIMDFAEERNLTSIFRQIFALRTQKADTSGVNGAGKTGFAL
jgi:hypothetical protein